MNASQPHRTLLAALLASTLLLGACATAPSSDPAAARSRQAGGLPDQSRDARPSRRTAAEPAVEPSAHSGAPLVDGEPAAAVAPDEPSREFERGIASWYGPGFHGRRTANGERFDMHSLTAAHKTLPFGTVVRVRSLVTGREVEVRVNDRGPFTRGRVIDLSRAAAEALGLLEFGVKNVLLLVPAATPLRLVALPAGKKRPTVQPAATAATAATAGAGAQSALSIP